MADHPQSKINSNPPSDMAPQQRQEASATDGQAGTSMLSRFNPAGHTSVDDRYHEAKGNQSLGFVLGTFLSLLFLVAIPLVGYIAVFSAAGEGFYAYKKTAGGLYLAYGLIGGSFTALLILSIFDFTSWKELGFEKLAMLKDVLLCVAGVCIAAGMVFLSEEYPYAPICLYMAGFPIYLLVLYKAVYRRIFDERHLDIRYFMGALPLPLLITSLCGFAFWVFWVISDPDNQWTDDTQSTYARKLNCEKSDDNGGDDDLNLDYDKNCLDAFMVWISPMAVSMATFLYGLIAYFLDDKESHRAPKAFGMILMFLLFGLWCAASLSGAGSGISDAFFAFVMAGMIALGFMVVGTFGYKAFKEEATHGHFVEEMKHKYGGMADVFRGLFVVTCAPLVGCYLFVSALKQTVRKASCVPCTKAINRENPDAVRIVTESATKLIRHALQWEWTAVLVYGLYWGIAFMVLNVIVSKFTVLLLSILISGCASIKDNAGSDGVGMFLVTLIIVAVGLVLFLLPPVPGVPIYLTGGIILVAAGTNNTDDANGGWGVVGSIVYTCGVSIALKLFACTVQQMGIGKPLSGSVGIRQAVGINSHTIRTMKLILSKPGLSLAKVSILIGGPDWPTSVLCGIMGLNLLPVLVGTLPVAFLIIPTVLAGSFAYLGSLDGGDWAWCDTMASIFLTVAGLVQTGSMIVAAYYLEKAVNEGGEELKNMPYDQEVLQADALARAKRKRYVEERKFTDIPMYLRSILMLAMALMTTSCYIVQIYSSSCFETYELTGSISELPGGKWYNFVTTLGWYCMAMFGLSTFLLIVFNYAISYRVSASIKERPLVIEEDDSVNGKNPGPTNEEL